MSSNDDKKRKMVIFFLVLMVVIFLALGFYILNIFCECISQETIKSLTNHYG